MLNTRRLYELMEEKDVKSLAQLSRETKIPYSTLVYMVYGHDMYVSTMVELSKYFNVPIDYLINKSYGIVTCTENGSYFTDTSNFVEVAVSSMM